MCRCQSQAKDIIFFLKIGQVWHMFLRMAAYDDQVGGRTLCLPRAPSVDMHALACSGGCWRHDCETALRSTSSRCEAKMATRGIRKLNSALSFRGGHGHSSQLFLIGCGAPFDWLQEKGSPGAWQHVGWLPHVTDTLGVTTDAVASKQRSNYEAQVRRDGFGGGMSD